MLVVVIKQLFRDLTFVFILYFLLLLNPMFFSLQNVPFLKKSVGSMYVKKEEWERVKKEEEEKGKSIERKKLINHTTKK